MVMMKSLAEKTNKNVVSHKRIVRPSAVQKSYLKRGLDRQDGKLPLFDKNGQRIKPQTIQSCMDRGWAEPWYSNAIKPDWLVCKLTDLGRKSIKG